VFRSFKKFWCGMHALTFVMSLMTTATAYPAFRTNNELSDNTVLVSWYGKEFHKKTMACGGRFNMYNPNIVAHKTLPCGTKVIFTNPENGTTVSAVVRDRGPYTKGRDFDLTKAGAKALGFVDEGIAEVQVQILPASDELMGLLAKS